MSDVLLSELNTAFLLLLILPDLLIDGIQLLLQHEGKCLSIWVTTGRQHVPWAEHGLTVIIIQLWELCVAAHQVWAAASKARRL